MKFILWTLVWFSLSLTDSIIQYWGYGGAKKYNARHPDWVHVVAGGIYLFLYIYLYKTFVE